jgi:hypothetical protein
MTFTRLLKRSRSSVLVDPDDISTAFDTIRRDILLQSLEVEFGVVVRVLNYYNHIGAVSGLRNFARSGYYRSALLHKLKQF